VPLVAQLELNDRVTSQLTISHKPYAVFADALFFHVRIVVVEWQ
jgi:hypothetical protein